MGNILRLEFKDVNFKPGMIYFWKIKQKKPYSVTKTTSKVNTLKRLGTGNGARSFDFASVRLSMCIEIIGRTVEDIFTYDSKIMGSYSKINIENNILMKRDYKSKKQFFN